MEIDVSNVKKLYTNYQIKSGYSSDLSNAIADLDGVFLDCVKSNFGTPDFIPIEGRWVVERTFSRMENYPRLTRNYERLLKVAAHIFIAACVLSSDVGWHIMCLCHHYMPVLTKSPYARRLSGDFRQASSVM